MACAFAALCYAELASMLPVSGSAYTYTYATLDELPAWIMGWLLLAFAIVSFGVLYLRTTRPDLPRVFRVPLYPFTPLLGIAACVWLMLGILNMMALLFQYYIPAGPLIYFLYGRKASKMVQSPVETGI